VLASKLSDGKAMASDCNKITNYCNAIVVMRGVAHLSPDVLPFFLIFVYFSSFDIFLIHSLIHISYQLTMYYNYRDKNGKESPVSAAKWALFPTLELRDAFLSLMVSRVATENNCFFAIVQQWY
jgi:hypothetical protein